MSENNGVWRPYNYLYHDIPMLDEVDFLAGEDAPSGIFKKGDIVRCSAFLMNTSLFTHWRPIQEDA